MTKIRFFLIVVALSLCFAIVNTTKAQTIIDSGECGINGNNLIWELTSDSVLTIRGSGAMANYNYSNSAPWPARNIKTLVIENGVTTIGEWAFFECYFKKAIISNSVTAMGELAFYRCQHLTDIYVSWTTPPSINSYVFHGVYQPVLLNIPEQLLSVYQEAPVWKNFVLHYEGKPIIGADWHISNDTLYVYHEGAIPNYGEFFYYTSAPWSVYKDYFSKLDIANTVTEIGNSAFAYCMRLTSITIPNNITSIGNDAFSTCSNLETVNFNAINCTRMCDFSSFYDVVFRNCFALTTLNIGNEVRNIPDFAFYNCSELTSVIIPNSVKAIVPCTFTNCKKLISTTIGNEVTTIGDWAFSGCTSLTSMIIGSSPTEIGNYAFAECHNLTSITSYSINPPTIYCFTFKDISRTIPIHVPCGYEENYRNDYWWSEFTNYTDCVGIYEVEFDTININVYPNPTTGELRIENNDLQIDNVQIFDIVGKLVISFIVSSQSQEIVINISPLTNGTYFVRLKTDKSELTKKVIKE